MDYAIRITAPASGMESFFSRLALHCEKLIVYEHPENPLNIHCHLVVFGYRGDDKNPKRWCEKALNRVLTSTQFSKKKQYKPKGEIEYKPVDEGSVSYASKGKHDPKYVKGWSDEEVAALKAKGFDKKDKPEKVTVSKDEKWYNDFEKDFLTKPNQVPTDQINFYDLVAFARSWNFKRFRVSNVAYHTKKKMCIETFCILYGTKIPKDYEFRIRYDV